MERPLRILMIASEAVPFAKTGGLGDVAGTLPRALQRRGHEVTVVLPRYGWIDGARHGLRPFHAPMGVWMGGVEEWCAVEATEIEGVTFALVRYDRYFDRPLLYHDAQFRDYADNPRRFAFLTRAALQLCRDRGWAPDVVHVHDWQTALGPAYLKVWHWNDPVLGGAASVLTIHNIAYQGRYPAEHWPYIGLRWDNFTADTFEDHGATNFLKGGIRFTDALSTVSPTYARETLGPIGGHGLGPYLLRRGADYVGILNGADYGEWDPSRDPKIPARYDASSLAGKAVCKRELQRRLQLEVADDIPVVGIVSRFVEQKGFDLLAPVIGSIVRGMRVQFAVLGAGDKQLEAFFGPLPRRYPGRIGTWIGYHDELAHWIEAGSDFFLMPSRYEPCGLNQIYSLRYATLPIVRATGGLDDTVEQYDERTGDGTGFKFHDPTPGAVHDTVGWAVSTFYDRKPHLEAMRRRAMSRDFSWERSAAAYERLYERAIANHRAL